MDRFQAMRIFSQVVESGSFAKAAEKLGLSTSAASRHIADLETHLNTRLLQEFAAPRVPIYAVYTSRKHLSARVRLFVDFLGERFGDAADFTRA